MRHLNGDNANKKPLENKRSYSVNDIGFYQLQAAKSFQLPPCCIKKCMVMNAFLWSKDNKFWEKNSVILRLAYLGLLNSFFLVHERIKINSHCKKIKVRSACLQELNCLRRESQKNLYKTILVQAQQAFAKKQHLYTSKTTCFRAKIWTTKETLLCIFERPLCKLLTTYICSLLNTL